MPNGLRVVLLTGLMVTGVLVALPQARGWFLFERTRGRVLEVFPRTLPDGRVSLAVAWFAILPDGQGGKVGQLSYQLGDADFHPLASDPVVSPERADVVIRAWLDQDLDRKRLRTVFYRREDPSASAMLLDETEEHSNRRLVLGIALTLTGFCWLVFGRRAKDWTTRWYKREG